MPYAANGAIMRICILSLIAICIFGCDGGSNDYHLNERTFDAKSLEMIQQKTGVTLPDGSRGLHLFWQGSASIDPSFVAKIEIPMSAGEAMTKQIGLLRNVDGSVEGSLTEKVAWWKPSNTARVERQYSHDGNYIRIVVCKEKDRWVLYLEWIKI